jgi:ribosomal protein L1
MLGGLKSRYYHRKGFYLTMAKKADLLAQAKQLGLKVTEKDTIAIIEAAIAGAAAPVVEVVETPVVADKPLAKAGKRSAKAVEEVEAKIEKEARKEAHDTSPVDPDAEEHVKRGPKPVTRPLIERRSKGYQTVAKLVEKDKVYTLAEALELATKTSSVKFDASVEIHVRLGVDPRQADQNIRATVSLPNGTGKTIRVAVFAPEADHAGATKAGADLVGDEAILDQLAKETIDFDVLITTPAYMPKLSKFARLLGPRGLMPNPKSGTVATDVAKATQDAKTGKVEYRVDKQSIIHLSVGKVSFGATKLEENAKAFFNSLMSQKPSSLKGIYIKGISISTTMGPGIKTENFVA